jgi:oligoendopeptidase F
MDRLLFVSVGLSTCFSQLIGEEKVVKLREEVPQDVRWNLEQFYESRAIWEGAFDLLANHSKEGWRDLVQYKGRTSEGPVVVKKILDAYFSYSRELDKVYTFAHLRHDENITDDANLSGYQKVLSLYHDFSNASSWIEPEILALDEKEINGLLHSSELKGYKFFFQKLLDQKKYVLDAEKEALFALAKRAQMTPHAAFSAMNNADLVFRSVLDSEGKEHVLTSGSYSSLMQNKDRTLRKNAFKELHQTYQKFENTLTQLLGGQIQNHIFNQKARGYDSCLQASLSRNNIPVEVYRSLIESTRNHLHINHEYVALRKKLLGVDELHYYDMQVSLVEDFDLKFSYDEAVKIVIDSVRPLGKEYGEILERGMKQDRWVDVYENKGKRTGGYSSGCYDSMPYILMNYSGRLVDLMTLSHEVGHSMNTLLSNRKQAYHESGYPLFVAEVASTFNEQLTYEYLLERAKNREERLYILNKWIDGMRSTFFRQVMFAEFELKIHELVEADTPLTPALLKEIYHGLNRDYFGPDLVIDEELDIECLRIPHFFYYDFYVYQYATGIVAASALVDKVKEEGTEKYLDFLASGGSDYPIPTLQKAGVDMLTSKPVEKFIAAYAKLVKTFEKEIAQKQSV